jgi:hypothetical protein
MKIQDIVFVAVFMLLVVKHHPKWSATAGLFCLGLAIPLFAFWVFFTAQRLVMYGIAFLLLSIILHIYYSRKA